MSYIFIPILIALFYLYF